MIEQVVIESEDGEKAAALAALNAKGCYKVTEEDGDLIVDVPDSNDAEEEITNLMNDAGVDCFVSYGDHFNPETCSHQAAVQNEDGSWYCPGCESDVEWDEDEEFIDDED